MGRAPILVPVEMLMNDGNIKGREGGGAKLDRVGGLERMVGGSGNSGS